ncbi:BQ5605_C006g04155 [Microbotryum silenes-dioicae]|uniref:BQ5605_C006g04155 protein n=1 Tax=Microbotryum silenes-dioicae TaxID=796604 RepID=A0A2X0M950_9BASI|nr:BQ5605_C006g04155 [Microbotryum silenes-dioicae]
MQHSYENSLQHVLIEYTEKNGLWPRELRLTIPWQILNVSVRWGDHHVSRGSEATPSRYSQVTRVGQRTVRDRNGTLSLKTFLLTTSLLILRPSRDCNVHRWWIHWMKLIFRQWKQCNW